MSQINDVHGQYFDYCPCFGKRKQPELLTKPIIYMEDKDEGVIVKVPVCGACLRRMTRRMTSYDSIA